MKTMPFLLAGVMGIVLGVGATWWLMHRTGESTAPVAGATPSERKVLYWYDPMVPSQHFEGPGKSPYMDMQLVPKYADQEGNGGAGVVRIDPRQVQNLGVRIARAKRGVLGRTVRATGAVAFDERQVSVVQARVAGIVERLEVRAPLTEVRQGQTLLTLLAPEWSAAQEEYLSLRRAKSPGLGELRDAARRRLLLLGMSEGQVAAIERSGQAQTRIAVVAPRAGVVSELSVREGATVVAGSALMRINGLDTVWVVAAVPEALAGRASTGAKVSAEVVAFPGERFDGEIEALLPELDPNTRTQSARIVLRNPAHRLAPGMYAQVAIDHMAEARQHVLVPSEAVIATGTRSVVIVAEGNGRFRAQEVERGDEAGGETEIARGLDEGTQVLLSGQFLIDSEASLSGTLARLEGVEAAQAPHSNHTSDEPGKPERFEAAGTIKRIDAKQWTIATDAIPALEMGAMNMTFVAPSNPDGRNVRSGERVRFTFFRNPDGDFEIEHVAVDAPGGTP